MWSTSHRLHVCPSQTVRVLCPSDQAHPRDATTSAAPLPCGSSVILMEHTVTMRPGSRYRLLGHLSPGLWRHRLKPVAQASTAYTTRLLIRYPRGYHLGMVYSQQFVRLTASGGIYADRWQCRVNFSSAAFEGSTPSESEVRTWMTQALPLAATAWTALVTHGISDGGAIFPQLAYLDEVKMAHIGVDGLYTQAPVLQTYSTGSRPQGITTGNFAQIALSCGLETAETNGRARRGRCYLPLGDVSQDSATGLITASTVTAITATWRTFVQSLKAITSNASVTAPVDLVPYVMSNVGSGKCSPVTGVRVGNRADVQRRRVNAYPESYTYAVLT